MYWCFALINNRLGEIYFDIAKNGKRKINGHCYVRKSEFKTKHEQEMIRVDTKKVNLVYRKEKYYDKKRASK